MSRALVVGVVLSLLGARAARGEVIKEIVVQENTKTEDATVLLIADIEKGDEFSYELLDEIKVRLVSSELFKSVDAFSEPVPGGVRITILAKDKHSWIVAPTFYNQPGNQGGGLGFAEANLFGENKKLLLYGQYATADSFFIGGYIDPSIGGTRFKWQLDTFLRWEDVTEYSRPGGVTDTANPVRTSQLRYLNGGLKLGFRMFRAFTFDARLRGAHVKWSDAVLEPGATCADVVDPEDTSAEAMRCDEATQTAPTPGDSGYDVSSEYIVAIDNRANWFGIQTGNRYKVAFERAEPELGSDFDYWYAGFDGFFGSKGHLFTNDNLILELSVGYGEDMPMQHEYTAGGVGLRGFRNREFRGDFKTGGSVEYSVPLFTFWSLSYRLLGFWDTAYVDYFDREVAQDSFRRYLPDPDEELGGWRNGVGGGVRIYFRSIVVPLLGFDVGYGLPDGVLRTYFAVGLTEL
jgi:outer membrane protein assembly factor BamA